MIWFVVAVIDIVLSGLMFYTESSAAFCCFIVVAIVCSWGAAIMNELSDIEKKIDKKEREDEV